MTIRSISVRTLDDRGEFHDDDEHELWLRTRILKLRWIGFEEEAAALVARLNRRSRVSGGPLPLEALFTD